MTSSDTAPETTTSDSSSPNKSVRAELKDERRRLQEQRDKTGRNKPWRRNFRRFRRTLLKRLANVIGPPLLRLLTGSWKVEVLNPELCQEFENQAGGIWVVWHGRMLCGLPLHRKKGYKVLVSPSHDGGLIAAVLRRNGYKVVSGSTNRGASRALRELTSHLSDGDFISITPDGPRGPRHSMNVGTAWLARETGKPILTVSVVCDRAWRARSWDRFTIPKFRARVVVLYGGMIRVAKDADDAELDRVTLQVRETLIANERRAFAHLGLPIDWDESADETTPATTSGN